MAFGSLEPSRVPLRTPGRSPYGSPVVIESRADMALLPQVLGIASLGFLASALGVYFAPPIYGSAMLWICVIVSFALIFAVRATRATPVLAFGLFLLLAVVMGVEISPWIRVLLGTGHTGAVFNAAVTTGVGMGVLGIGGAVPPLQLQAGRRDRGSGVDGAGDRRRSVDVLSLHPADGVLLVYAGDL